MSKFIAIDLDPQGIFAVSGTARGGHSKVESVVAWDGTDGDLPPALTVDSAKQIGEQLRERLKAVGAGASPVLISIPRDRVILKEIRYPAVPITEEPNVVRFQAMKELTDSADEIVLDYIPLANRSAEDERRSMVVAVRKGYFSAIQAMCAAANFKLAAVTPRPFGTAAGLARAFAIESCPRPESKTEPVANLTLNPGGGEFTVIRMGTASGATEVLFTRTISAPSLASETALLVEVRRNLTMYAGAFPGSPIQALYVAEPEGRRVNLLKNSLRISVHAYDPLSGVTTVVPVSNHGWFAGAVGLLAANSLGELPINFAAPRQPQAEKDPKKKQILIAAAGVSLLVVVGIAIGLLVVDSAQDDLAALQRQKADLEAEINTLEADFKRHQAAKQWQSRQVNWLDLLFDVSDQFKHTDEMTAKSYTGKAIPPDPKTGKQDAQASLVISLTSHSDVPVNELLTQMNGDSGPPAKAGGPPVKFYQAVDKNIGGPPSGDSAAREYTVVARVTGRVPSLFSRFPAFVPPSRKNYPPPVAVAKEPEPVHEPEAKTEDKEKDPKEKDPKDKAPAAKPKDMNDEGE